MYHTPTNTLRSRKVAPSPSLDAERTALRLFGDRTTRAILAVFHARRCAQGKEFFVPPHIAKLNGLSPSDLSWALGKLEGKLVVTQYSEKGKWRMLRLVPEFEEDFAQGTIQDNRRHVGTGKVRPDEERVVFDKADILRRAASLRDEMPFEFLQSLKRVSPQPGPETARPTY